VDLPPDPDRRLAPQVLISWVAGGVASTIAAGVAASVLVPVLRDVGGMPGWVAPLVIAITALFGLTATAIAPVLRYRTWRYAIREEEIDLLHGSFRRTRTIVPMIRVQHVDTSQGVLGRMLDITTLTVHTAAGSHGIPGLDIGDADRLRTEIAMRARVPDDV
jgi:membrane protein YdbS with pleckstrin-like domain